DDLPTEVDDQPSSRAGAGADPYGPVIRKRKSNTLEPQQRKRAKKGSRKYKNKIQECIGEIFHRLNEIKDIGKDATEPEEFIKKRLEGINYAGKFFNISFKDSCLTVIAVTDAMEKFPNVSFKK